MVLSYNGTDLKICQFNISSGSDPILPHMFSHSCHIPYIFWNQLIFLWRSGSTDTNSIFIVTYSLHSFVPLNSLLPASLRSSSALDRQSFLVTRITLNNTNMIRNGKKLRRQSTMVIGLLACIQTNLITNILSTFMICKIHRSANIFDVVESLVQETIRCLN